MEFFLRGRNEDLSSTDSSLGQMDIQRCPFLRNINEPTNFSFTTPISFPLPVRGAKGPIFEDGPNFDMAFRLFHGRDGVVPLSGKQFSHPEVESSPQFNPLAAKAATISLSAFGPGGPFSFDAFSDKWKKQKKKPSKESSSQGSGSSHEAMSNEWLQTGNCPIAKSYRAVSSVLPLVAKALQPPAGMKFRCPPAVVAARAALARTALVKNLRPQPLHSKMLVIAMLGMAANVPLGIWREHTKKFSPSCFVAVHAAVPFIAMLRSSVLMPKTAMAFTIAASILGQFIGSRAERHRLRALPQAGETTKQAEAVDGGNQLSNPPGEMVVGISNSGHCSKAEWNAAPLKANTGSRAALAHTALVKNLQPQFLPFKMLVIAMLGRAANVPPGIWRELSKKFSPSWFVAVRAAVPFIAMLRKSVLMPKTAMAVTIAASILGQVIGSRAERHRLRALPQAGETTTQAAAVDGGNQLSNPPGEMVVGITNSGHCGEAEWNAAPLKANTGSPSTAANTCYQFSLFSVCYQSSVQTLTAP